jgi:catalase
VAPTPEQLVDAINAVAGAHAGHRAAHAKGVLCAGTFTPTGAAGALTRAAHFAGGRVRAHVRFSNGSGDPGAHDGARDGRGMAVKLYLPDGTTTDIVAISLPVFFVRTPEDFLVFTHARVPDPETGQPDLQKVGAFLAEHPETVPAVQFALSAEPPASYAQCAYHGLHAFGFEGADGRVRWVRYHWEPEAGEATLSDAEAHEREPDYLSRELAERLERGPVGFSLRLQLAGEDDPIDDPTAAWPEDRETVEAGRLEVSALAFDRDRDGDVLVFDPTRVTDGIVCSPDPILAVRSQAYSVSVERRSGAPRPATV